MTDKLSLYQMALGHLQERKLRALSENAERRRVLDDYYDQTLAYCLERKFWNFSYRTVQIDAESALQPAFGYQYGFLIPTDWIRTRKFSASPTLDPPLLRRAEEAGYWWTDVSPVYVEYNSNNPIYGMDLGRWPATFTAYVALRLASESCNRITGSGTKLDGPNGLIKREEKAYKIAAANCAMNEAVSFAPRSGWVSARRGMTGMSQGPGGDSPTGGSLIS